MGFGIEIAQRQLLDSAKQILPQLPDNPLGGLHHQLRVTEGGRRPCQINRPHKRQHPDKAADVPGQDIPVDHRLEQIGAEHVGPRADQDQQGNQEKHRGMPLQISQQPPESQTEIFGLFVPHGPRHYAVAPFFWDAQTS